MEQIHYPMVVLSLLSLSKVPAFLKSREKKN